MNQLLSCKTKLSTPLFEETRDWYRELLDLSLLEQWDDPADRGCILGFGAGQHEALLEVYHAKSTHDYSGLSLQFRVEDVDKFDVPNEPRFAFRGPESRHWGSRYLLFADPNDVSVVIFSGSSF
jgi:catechol 2,3-dioxygenase-like lactoylglutathione lyase family enzyme